MSNLFTIPNSKCKVTLSGRCQKCFIVNDHGCSHYKAIAQQMKSDKNVNLQQQNDKSFQCQFCDYTIAHKCSGNIFLQKKNENFFI